jgi:predicted metal-dependent peptidase
VTTKPKFNPNDEALRIERQIVRMVVDHPFFATLILKMSLKPTPSVPTFCTDGVTLFYNPAFSASLDDQEILTVLAHEVLHPAFGHLWRLGDRDMRKWNIATDYEINNYLVQYNEDESAAGRVAPFKLPQGALIDAKYNNMVGEEIYPLLGEDAPPPPPPPPPGEGEPCDDGDPGDQPGNTPSDRPGKSDGKSPNGNNPQKSPNGDPTPGDGGMGDFMEPAETPGNSEGEWQNRLVEGHNSAKLQGRGAGNIARIVEKHLKGQQDWRHILRDLLSAAAADDYDEQRPDRRFLEDDIFLPTLYSERVGEFVVAIDTSGSIQDGLLTKFLGEVQYCMDTVRPERITVIDCDTQVNTVEEYSDGDDITSFRPKGGGGTDFKPVFDHARNMTKPPEAIVYFTDGYGDFPKDSPDCPVIWVDYGGAEYPWGEVVRVNTAN